MNPRVTIRTKIRIDIAQKMKVWLGLVGAKLPILKEPCHTTSSTETASTTAPIPSSERFFMSGPYSIVLWGGTMPRDAASTGGDQISAEYVVHLIDQGPREEW